jgi:hypothetical protein
MLVPQFSGATTRVVTTSATQRCLLRLLQITRARYWHEQAVLLKEVHLLLIIHSIITGKNVAAMYMNHSVYKYYNMQNCMFACCCNMGMKLGLSYYGNDMD